MPKSLAAQLTSREYSRVSRVVTQRYPRDTSRTKSEYLELLWKVALELYPQKVSR